jgi:hypothetical protein
MLIGILNVSLAVVARGLSARYKEKINQQMM